MMYLDAYHLSSAMTREGMDKRICADVTCLHCGYVDESANGHYCPVTKDARG